MDHEDEGNAIIVGKLFNSSITEWPDGSMCYAYNDGQHLLQVNLASPTETEIHNFQKAPIHAGLYAEQDVMFLIFKLDGVMDWSDQSFSLGRVHPECRRVPSLEEGQRILLPLVLVDAATGIVVAMRATTYSRHISQLITNALKNQESRLDQFDLDKTNRVVDAIYSKFPDAKSLAGIAAHIGRMGT